MRLPGHPSLTRGRRCQRAPSQPGPRNGGPIPLPRFPFSLPSDRAPQGDGVAGDFGRGAERSPPGRTHRARVSRCRLGDCSGCLEKQMEGRDLPRCWVKGATRTPPAGAGFPRSRPCGRQLPCPARRSETFRATGRCPDSAKLQLSGKTRAVHRFISVSDESDAR